jgi:ACS family hexuronate transporter-like MFS transporter
MTETASLQRSHLRWWICLIVFFAVTIIYSDRSFLSLLKSTLANEIHWSDTQFADANSWFLGAYAFGQLFFGRFIDRVGVKIGFVTTVFFWSLAALSHTLVASVAGFTAARIFLGLSEAGTFPAAIKTIAQWFPRTERAFATALFNSGATVGSIVAPFLVAWLLAHGFSWRTPFFISGGLGVIWVVVWLCCFNTPEKHSLVSPGELAWIRSDPASPEETAPAVSWFSLFRYSQTWSFVVAKFLTDPVWYFLLFWLPDFFKKTRHLDIKASYPHLMTIYLIVNVLSIAGGYLPGYLTRHGWSVTLARKTALFCYAAFVLPILLVSMAGDWTAVVLIGVVGAAHQSWSANLFTTVSDMFPRNTVASVVGMGTMAGGLGAMLFQHFCGHVLDNYGASQAQAGYALLFGYSAFAYLIAFGLQHLLAPKFEPFNLHAGT